MENLQEQLTIENACIEEWTHRKTKKDGLKVNFTVSAMLPKLLAEQLKCGGIYDNDTKRVDLTHKLKDIELIVPVPGVEGGFASFFPDVLYAFHALRDEQQFTIEFSAHVTVRAEELHEILKGLPEVITLSVRPRQGQLFEGGTRVDVAGTTQNTTSNEEPESVAAPLASAVAMGEGTHQKRKPRADKSTVN